MSYEASDRIEKAETSGTSGTSGTSDVSGTSGVGVGGGRAHTDLDPHEITAPERTTSDSARMADTDDAVEAQEFGRDEQRLGHGGAVTVEGDVPRERADAFAAGRDDARGGQADDGRRDQGVSGERADHDETHREATGGDGDAAARSDSDRAADRDARDDEPQGGTRRVTDETDPDADDGRSGIGFGEDTQETQARREEFAAEHDPAQHDVDAGEEFRQPGDWVAGDDADPREVDEDGNLTVAGGASGDHGSADAAGSTDRSHGDGADDVTPSGNRADGDRGADDVTRSDAEGVTVSGIEPAAPVERTVPDQAEGRAVGTSASATGWPDDARAGTPTGYGSAPESGSGGASGPGADASSDVSATTDTGSDRRTSSFDEVQDGGYGVGSAVPLADGAMPLGHPVKAWNDTMTYADADHPAYGADPHVWFTDPQAAESAGFRRADA